MKICRICKKNKKNKEFNKNRALEDGLQTYCRECQKELNHQYYLKNKKLKSHEIEHKIPVRIVKTQYTPRKRRLTQEELYYIKKGFNNAQNEPQSLWERIKSLF
jgi:hypothetical protein